MQYYGLDDDRNTVYVAMSEQEVIDYAKEHPEEGITRVEDRFRHGYNLTESKKMSITESLKNWDRKEFEDNSNTYELEMLYESVKTTLSAQQKNDLSRFVKKAKTAEEISTYMTGMLAQGKMNEAFDKEPHEFWYYTKHGLGPGTIPRDVEILDVKEDDNWGTYIKLNKVLTTDELNKYEIKEKIPPDGLQEDVDESTFNKLKEIAYELDEYIEDKVWVRDFWFDGQFDNTISFEIYGDWKHDHARFNYYASEWLDNKGLKYKMWETITDDDGSDSYGATHTIRLYDIAEENTVTELTEKFNHKKAEKDIDIIIDALKGEYYEEVDIDSALYEFPERMTRNKLIKKMQEELQNMGYIAEVFDKANIDVRDKDDPYNAITISIYYGKQQEPGFSYYIIQIMRVY